MQIETARNGNRVVISNNQNSSAVWESRLYVNKGETATLVHAKHKSINAATKWAAKQVAK